MADRKLVYPLQNDKVVNWLILGPVEDTESGEDAAAFLARFEEPLEMGRVFVPGRESSWKYLACGENGRIEVADSNPANKALRYAAYVELSGGGLADTSLQVESNQAVSIILDGKPVSAGQNGCVRLAGKDHVRVWLVTEPVNCDPVFWLASVKLRGAGEDEIQAGFPTSARHPRRFQTIEKQFAGAHLEEAVNYKGGKFNLRWPEDTADDFSFHYQVQDEQERIYVEGTWTPEAGGTDIGHTIRLNERKYRVVLRAPAREYYELNNRYQIELPLQVLDTDYRAEPSGSYSARRKNALTYTSKKVETIHGQAALQLLGNEKNLDAALLGEAAGQLVGKSVEELKDFLLLGSMFLRGLPRRQTELKNKIKQAAQRILEQHDTSEDDLSDMAIVRDVSLIMAASIVRKKTAAKQPLARAKQWVRQKGMKGLDGGVSAGLYETVIAALACLCTFGGDEELIEMAAVMLDRLLIDLVTHSYQGALGCAMVSAEADTVKSNQMDATSGLMRMLFGVGVYNPYLTALICLAGSEYQFPSFLQDIAIDKQKDQLTREAINGRSLMLWREKSGMLSSFQDWEAGQAGKSEVVWKAVLGVDQAVFVNHPATISQNPHFSPGYWIGNARKPRVAQWKDVLVSVHVSQPEDLDFTHALFPTYKFDEYRLQDGWAFARHGDGYLALTAARGLQMTSTGVDAYRELRSYGFPNIWICQMGNSSRDGNFDRFIKKFGKLKLSWPDSGVEFKSIRGNRISFGWQKPFMVDGAVVGLDFSGKETSPYLTRNQEDEAMDLAFEGTLYRLTFK